MGAFITFVLIRHTNKRAESANKKQINTPSKSMHPGSVMAARIIRSTLGKVLTRLLRFLKIVKKGQLLNENTVTK